MLQISSMKLLARNKNSVEHKTIVKNYQSTNFTHGTSSSQK